MDTYEAAPASRLSKDTASVSTVSLHIKTCWPTVTRLDQHGCMDHSFCVAPFGLPCQVGGWAHSSCRIRASHQVCCSGNRFPELGFRAAF